MENTMQPETDDRVVFSNGDEGRIFDVNGSFAEVRVWGTHEIKTIRWTYWRYENAAWRK